MPSRLTLRERRMRARGINARVARAWAGRKFTDIGRRATLTLSPAGADNNIHFMAKAPGTGGNAITVRIVVAGNNTPLSVSVAGSAITINSATSAGGAATSTGTECRRAVNFSSTAGPLVWASTPKGESGSGVVAAVAATNLTGGT